MSSTTAANSDKHSKTALISFVSEVLLELQDRKALLKDFVADVDTYLVNKADTLDVELADMRRRGITNAEDCTDFVKLIHHVQRRISAYGTENSFHFTQPSSESATKAFQKILDHVRKETKGVTDAAVGVDTRAGGVGATWQGVHKSITDLQTSLEQVDSQSNPLYGRGEWGTIRDVLQIVSESEIASVWLDQFSKLLQGKLCLEIPSVDARK